MDYLIFFMLLLAIELVYFRIADHYNIIDKPSERGSSKDVTLRGGGIIFYFGAVAACLFTGMPYPFFFMGITLVSFISFWDDIRSLHPSVRLGIQTFAMLLMLYDLGLYSWEYWWVCVIAVVVYTGAMNVYNFMDGINGITGGYSIVALLTLLYVDLRIVSFIEREFIIISALAVFVFCLFNFRTKAKCFAGDVGSVSIGFIVLFCLGKLIVQTQDASWLVILAIYGIDGCLTIIHRIMLGEKLSTPHRNHAYQIMANELKIPHVSVSMIYMAMQLIVNAIYLCYPGYLSLVGLLSILSVAYIVFMRKYFHLHIR